MKSAIFISTLCGSFLLFVIPCAVSQTVASARNGSWNNSSTWQTGVVPSLANASEIIINHAVVVDRNEAVEYSTLVVNASLTIHPKASLIMQSMAPSRLIVNGTLICLDSSTVSGTSAANTQFENGSIYDHRHGPAGFVPIATWNANSTFKISGFTTSGYINQAHSDGWKQRFGNVIYDCPQQSVFVVDLNGYLHDIAGDFSVKNTNSKTLRLSTTQESPINIDGNLIVEGPSEIWFSTNASPAQIHVKGDVLLRSTSTGPSYLGTRGVVNFNIDGKLVVDASGPLRMASSALDSAGIRNVTINVGGDLSILRGGIIAPPVGNGNAQIVFNGVSRQSVTVSSATAFAGNLHFKILKEAAVDLGTSILSSVPGSLSVSGKLGVGSTHALGAIQLTGGGNIQIPGPRTFEAGSTVMYNGNIPQFVGNGHPTTPGVNFIADNPTSVALINNLISVGDFVLSQGSFQSGSSILAITGNVDLGIGTHFQSRLTLVGSNNQQMAANGATINEVFIDKTGGSTVALLSPLFIASTLSILSDNTTLQTNGFLTLHSSSDGVDGTAFVGALSPSSRIEGDVTVQRYMSGEGRIYRYISSPVEHASVLSLMDDLPVTGTFADPSTGAGLSSSSPSLFEYDESIGGLVEGWLPFPSSGQASEAILKKGQGYAVFIRKGVGNSLIDFTGRLNQGDLHIPINFTSNNQAGNGWNLVGNPYASPVYWDDNTNGGWLKQGVSQVISIRDNGAGGVYHYWDGDMGDITGGRIASGQSFWVRAMGTGASLTIRESSKTSSGAEFFRRKQEKVPWFSLSITNGSDADKVYYKLRDDALETLDTWDGVKMPNEFLNIGFKRGDRILAIDASNKLPCDGPVPIVVDSKLQGVHRLTIDTLAALENYRYYLIEPRDTSLIEITPGVPLNLDLSAGVIAKGYSLLVKPPDMDSAMNALEIETCYGQLNELRITGMMSGLEYTYFSTNDVQLSLPVMGTGLTESFRSYQIIPLLHQARIENAVKVSVRNLCGDVYSKFIALKNYETIEVSGDTVCVGDRARLIANADDDDIHFSWFDSADGKDTLDTGDSLLTQPLLKPQTFFVCGTTIDGCTSTLQKVNVAVRTRAVARISKGSDGSLSSDAKYGNRWLNDGLCIADSGARVFDPQHSGLYVLEVLQNGCVSRDSMMVDLDKQRQAIAIYPNPVRDYLSLTSLSNHVAIIEVIDVSGQIIIRDDKECQPDRDGLITIDVAKLSSGVYILSVTQEGRTSRLSFLKE